MANDFKNLVMYELLKLISIGYNCEAISLWSPCKLF